MGFYSFDMVECGLLFIIGEGDKHVLCVPVVQPNVPGLLQPGLYQLHVPVQLIIYAGCVNLEVP